jgi:putative two-component system response regulator
MMPTIDNSEILIVGDEPHNHLIIEEALAPYYNLHKMFSGDEVLEYIHTGGNAVLILCDVIMPKMNGFELCRRLKGNSSTKNIPFLFLTYLDDEIDEEHGLLLGAEDFIHKPFSSCSVLARVRNHLKLHQTTQELRVHNQNLEILVEECSREILSQKQAIIAAQRATITALCSLTEARDNETGNHIVRTQYYVKALAQHLSNHPLYQKFLDENSIRLISNSAPLHDIGKVAIPDHILLKPGKLDREERTIMQKHCEYGRNTIAKAEAELDKNDSFLMYAREIAYFHHERWDGSGYPLGIKEEKIPLSARLMALADVYDALVSHRVYKHAFTHEQSIDIISRGRANQFDPNITDAFLEISDEFHHIALIYSDANKTSLN